MSYGNSRANEDIALSFINSETVCFEINIKLRLNRFHVTVLSQLEEYECVGK